MIVKGIMILIVMMMRIMTMMMMMRIMTMMIMMAL
jgi:hypothetical protein